MVASVNSNRPVQIPQPPAKDDAPATRPGKSGESVGHKAKQMLAETLANPGTDPNPPNAMGKFASEIAKMKIDGQLVPDMPLEPTNVIEKPAVVTEEPAIVIGKLADELLPSDAQIDKTETAV